MEDCIRCHEQPPTTEDGMCAHCHWAIREEIVYGLREIEAYAARNAAFEQWCAERAAQQAPTPESTPQGETDTSSPVGDEHWP